MSVSSTVKRSNEVKEATRDIEISAHDPNSFANNRAAKITHSHIVLAVSFAESVLAGHVDHAVELVADATELILDTAPTMEILRAEAVGPSGEVVGSELKYEVGKMDAIFGVPLAITLPEGSRTAGSKIIVRVTYRTAPDAGAIQWLPKEQTQGGVYPYLFTQCQAIHCRSLMPCQDTPSNKFTYSASIDVDAPLVALMSARQVATVTTGARTQCTFNQPEPIPSYLLALAVGALEKRQIGPRSHVWSEAGSVDAGAHEFADTEKFLAAGEAICGPYSWGTYDIVVMPPSFPYGGMENPQITYVTPTLLAGDRSLANVVAHEIAHSWFGNFVTSETWESFWMNEGFTVFLERKICKAIYGKAFQDLHAQIGLNDLQKSVDRFGADHPHTCLCPRLKGIDPDDAFSSVPYEKGFNFLTYLENLVGGEEVMNKYLRAHCDKYAHSTVNSSQFKEFFLSYMSEVAKIPAETLAKIDWDAWYNKPGMPCVQNVFDQTLIKDSEALAKVLLLEGGAEAADKVTKESIKGWDSAQIVILLEAIIDAQKKASSSGDKAQVAAFADRLQAIDKTFEFTLSKNSEVRFRWLTLCIRQPFPDRYPAVEAFLREQGRMKYIRPLYRDLFESGGGGRDFAIALFKEIGPKYHSIASKMVAKDLQLAK